MKNKFMHMNMSATDNLLNRPGVKLLGSTGVLLAISSLAVVAPITVVAQTAALSSAVGAEDGSGAAENWVINTAEQSTPLSALEEVSIAASDTTWNAVVKEVEPLRLRLSRQLAPSALAREVNAPAPRSQRATRASEIDSVLRMERAVQLAVQQHPSIADAVATLAQQAAGVDYARAGYFPQVRVGLGGGSNNGTNGSSTLATVSASQMLYDFGKVDTLVNRSEALVRKQQAVVLREIDAITKQTAEAALSVHRYQALTDIARGQVEAVEKVLELSELRANAGLSTKADPIQARARVQAAHAYLGQVSAELAQWRQKLRTFVGEIGASPVEVLPGLQSESLWVTERPEFELLPDVLIAQAERQAAEMQLTLAKASKLPTVSLDASGNRAIHGVNPNTMDRHGNYGSIMVNVSVPLYQGGAMNAQIRSAAAEELATRERIETTLLLASDQSRAWRELAVGAQSRLADVENRRQSILSVRDLYREQYQLGTRSILDLLNAEQEIHQAEADAQGVLHDLWQYRLEFITSTGRLRELFGLNHTVIQGMEISP